MLEEIHKKIFDIWDTKFKILELNSKKEKCYTIYHDLTKLDIYKVYITSLLKIIWDFPESVFYIIKNANIVNFKEDLSNFIVNSLFCNNISVNYMENNLLYVITMMLKKEIDDLKSKEEITLFLEETKTAFLLEQMVKMPDVQIYFRKIIFKMVEKVENYGSLKKINFNTDIILREIKMFIEEETKKLGKKEKKTAEELILKYISTKILEQSMNDQEEDDKLDEETKIKNSIRLDENFKKYEKNISITELENLKSEAEKNNKRDLVEYYEELIKNINQRNCLDLYWNNFINKYSNDNEIKKDYLLFIYQKDFLNVISFLEIFINDLLINISSIPSSIKYICKIISILIKNKFNDLSKFELNSFISKFFIEKLLLPILKAPSTNVLLNDFVISETTQYNLVTVGIILKYVFQGQLFRNNFILQNQEEENYYTFFNQFILEQNEKIIYFFQKIVDTSLPPFIDKYLNNSLPSDYLYDYFTENPGQMFVSISICFNMRNLIALIHALQNSENDLFNIQNNKVIRLKKIYNKFKTEEKINELKGFDLNQTVTQRKSSTKSNNNDLRKTLSISKPQLQSIDKFENYYVINEYEIEDKFHNLFKVQNKIAGFYIDIKKIEKKGKLEEKEKNIIKFKNYLINSLMNYSVLNRSSITKTESVLSVLTQIHKYMSLPNYILNDNGIIPANWSISSVLEYMKKIPEEYKENDYQKFFVELTKNLEDSISEFDFETIFMFKKRLQFLDKRQQYYTNCLQVLEDINYNGVVKDFVEKYFCPIEVKFCYDDDDEKKFELKKSNINKKVFKDSDIIENAKNEKVIFKTVSSFVRYFPDLNKYQDKKDINPFQIIKELSINKKIFDYFELIKNNFIHEKICNEDEYDKIYDEKIKNYIMNKIYKKIYPGELEYEDSKLFEKTMHLSWVEPNMIIPGDTSLDALDNILPDILEEFKKLNKANSPYTKLKCIKKIFEYIAVIVKFNDGGEGENREVGAEDITPYLNFILIRACPVRIFSDIKFIKFFLKDEGKLEYDFLNVEMMCKNILDSTYKNFNISESDYIKKCNEAIINNKINSDKRFNEIIDRFEITNN